jgi:hypothetical protein
MGKNPKHERERKFPGMFGISHSKVLNENSSCYSVAVREWWEEDAIAQNAENKNVNEFFSPSYRLLADVHAEFSLSTYSPIASATKCGFSSQRNEIFPLCEDFCSWVNLNSEKMNKMANNLALNDELFSVVQINQLRTSLTNSHSERSIS